MMKKWKPAPGERLGLLRQQLPVAGSSRENVWYSCSFAKGNMFAGLHEAGMVLRLPDENRASFFD